MIPDYMACEICNKSGKRMHCLDGHYRCDSCQFLSGEAIFETHPHACHRNKRVLDKLVKQLHRGLVRDFGAEWVEKNARRACGAKP